MRSCETGRDLTVTGDVCSLCDASTSHVSRRPDSEAGHDEKQQREEPRVGLQPHPSALKHSHEQKTIKFAMPQSQYVDVISKFCTAAGWPGINVQVNIKIRILRETWIPSDRSLFWPQWGQSIYKKLMLRRQNGRNRTTRVGVRVRVWVCEGCLTSHVYSTSRYL